MMFATTWLSTIDEIIGGAFNIIWAFLCVPVYMLVRTLFNIFIKIAELDILSNADMNEIYKRVTMIITIVMAFYVVFSIVKYTISPDTVSDKEKGAGKLAYRIIVTIVLIAFVPDIFSMAYKLQNRLISSQIFSKVILGQEAWDYSSYGSSFAADTFSAFYRVDRDHCGDNCDKAQEHVSDVIEDIRQEGSVIHIIRAIGGQTGLSLTGNSTTMSSVEFDGLLALIFGCFTVYVLFLYCADVGVRYVQLLYLQVIAPIAIMGYIAPGKDNMFKKWVKQCLTTYLDLFIRISIMYFAMLIIKILGHSMKITEMTSDGKNIGPFAYIFFIMGVLIFVQRAPKLIGELLPSNGAAGIGFGLEWKTRGDPLKKSYNAIKKPVAATAGAIASTLSTVKSLKNGKLKEALKKKDYSSLTNSKFANSKFGRKLPFLKSNGFYSKLDGAWIAGKSFVGGGKDAAKNNSIIGAITNKDKQERAALNLMDAGGSSIGHDIGGMYFENEKQRFKQFLDGLDAVLNARKTSKESVAETKMLKGADAFVKEMEERGLGSPTARSQFKKDIEKLQNIYATSKHETADIEKVKAGIEKAFTATKIYDMDADAEARFKLKLKSEGLEAQVKQRFESGGEKERIKQRLEQEGVPASEIDAQIEVKFNEKVATELEAELASRVNTEKARLQLEKKAAIESLKYQFENKDVGSTEVLIHEHNLEEAQKIVLATKDATGQPMKIKIKVADFGSKPDDPDVDVDFVEWAASADTDEKKEHVKREFAKHFGDIEKYIQSISDTTKYSSEYKEANANANVPGKKDDGQK